MTFPTVALVAFCAAILYTATTFKSKRNNPPGPKPLPFIGNLLDFPRERAWLTYTRWKEQYGDIVYMDVLGRPMVILNSLKACNELLEKRSIKTSDRSHSIMLNDLMGWGFHFGMMAYTPRWRRHRRLFHQHFTENACINYHPIQQRTTFHLLQRLLETPEDFLTHTRLAFAESILDTIYSIQVKDYNDDLVQNVERAMASLTEAAIPGRYLVDTFSFLNYIPSWFPGGGFKKQAAEWKKVVLATKDLPFAHVQEQTEKGNTQPSVFTSMLEMAAHDGTVDGETAEEAAKSCASVAYSAGADTTLSATQTIFMVMANNPKIQKGAHEEVDKVVGTARLPNFNDMPYLPTIAAIAKEVLRWHSIGPTGLAHALSEDEEYNGYVLRKGTVVLPNLWHITHDPEVYPDPFKFDPMRWLIDTPEGRKINPDVPEPDAVFGFGRRGCPGRHFAKDSLLITVASILTCFDIKPLDTDGKPAERVAENFTDGFIVYPAPFKVSITPRTSEVASLIKELDSYHS